MYVFVTIIFLITKLDTALLLFSKLSSCFISFFFSENSLKFKYKCVITVLLSESQYIFSSSSVSSILFYLYQGPSCIHGNHEWRHTRHTFEVWVSTLVCRLITQQFGRQYALSMQFPNPKIYISISTFV